MLGSAALLAWAVPFRPARHAIPTPTFVLLSGGLMLGAWFMATDMATSPVTPRGIWLYGALIGVVTVVIRYFGGLTEGVMYAILIANATGPLLDQFNQPRILGGKQREIMSEPTHHQRSIRQVSRWCARWGWSLSFAASSSSASTRSRCRQ